MLSLLEASKRKTHEVTELKVYQEPFNVKDILQYNNLETLVIEDTEVEMIEENIFYLKGLKNLSILNNTRLESVFIPENCTSNIYSLNLSRNSLNIIPKNLNKFINLKRLNLEKNKIYKWDKGIFELELEYLNLGDNRLIDVPESILNLTSLYSLVLKNNKIRSLNLFFKNDAYLRNLFLSDNQIEDFCISDKAFQLESLFLDANDINSVPETIKQLKSLKLLSFYNNPEIRTLPDWIFEALPNLCELNFSAIGLQKISEKVSKLSKLYKLDLSDNKLKDIPDSLYQLEELKFLNISANDLTEISDKINNLSSIRRLDASLNSLKNFPEIDNKNMEFIDLSANAMHEETKNKLREYFAAYPIKFFV